MAPDRRTFLKRSAAVVSAAIAPVGACLSAVRRTQSSDQTGTSPLALDPSLLRAVGEAVLPESLGASGRERAVVAFEFWWDAFEPDAELVHPYGGWVIPHGPPDREPEWSEQLSELDRTSRARFDRPFPAASADQRRVMLTEQISDEGETFPLPAYADHVAVALMAHYFGSPEATNRCYGVEIDKMTCRNTASAGEIPPQVSG